MQKTQMRRIKISLHGLKPVAVSSVSQSPTPRRFHQSPSELGQRRQVVPIRTHVGPDNAVSLDARIRGDTRLLVQLASGRLVRRVHALALDVKFPSVIEAAEPVLLVPSKKERRATMRTNVIDQTDLAVGVAESN